MKLKPEILNRGEAVSLALRELYHSYGYRTYRMSKFEPYDLYAQNRSFVAGENLLTFTDTNGRLMALKPDVTLSIIKHYRGGQQKVCYTESVYRDTGSAREFREILQTGLECIGEVGLYEQCEVLTLAAESLGRISDEFILDVASVGLVAGLLAATDAGGETKEALCGLVREKNAHTVRSLCAARGIAQETARVWEALASLYGGAQTLLPTLQGLCLNREMERACGELSQLCSALGAGQKPVRVNIDCSIIRDLRYYNGLVFKGYVPGVHDAILSGGRYDNLVKKLGKQAGAIGFAVYLDRLEELEGGERRPDADVLLCYGGAAPEAALEAARALRAQGMSVRVQKAPDEGRYGRVIQL